MSFPSISYKYNNLDEAKLLVDAVEQKMLSLGKFIPKETTTIFEVEFQKLTTHHSGRIHRVEANLTINGILYRAEALENSFEEAVDKVRDELDGDLSRTKDKQTTLRKRAGRALKSLLSRG